MSFLILNNYCFFIFFIFYSFLFNKSLADGIVAVVQNHVILQSEVLESAQMQLFQEGKNSFKSQNELNLYLEKNLESLINQRVLFEAAKLDTEIVISNSDVDLYLENHINNLINQHGSIETLEKLLKKPIKIFKRESWDDVYKLLLSERYQQKLILNIDISRKEIEFFYKNFKDSLSVVPAKSRFSLIDIPIYPGENAEKKTYSFLLSIKDSILNNNNNFFHFAQTYSDDPGSGFLGGDLGFTERGSLVSEYEKEAFSLKINSISNPIKTIFGLHLIQLLDKRGDKIKTRHILKKITPMKEDTIMALEKIRSIYKNLEKNSVVFDSIALNFKNKNYGQSNVFDWTFNSEISELLLNQINYLQNNTFYFPFKSNEGYIILYLHKKEKELFPTLENSFSLIKNMALQNKIATKLEEWLNVNKTNFFIKYYN